MLKINNPTIGSDPEFGAVLNGKPISVSKKLGGSKEEPKDIGNGCASQEDNVMAELTIPPCRTKEEFINYINYGKQTMEKILQEKIPEAKIVSISSAFYDESELRNKEVREFGCTPSYCIYTQDISPRPSAEEVGNLRSAGFHIHIGTEGIMSIPEIERIIFCMDIMLGIPSMKIDKDEYRRNLYGNAGDFRYKFIPEKDLTIVEYRTLGGNMSANDDLLSYVWEQTFKAIELYNDETFEINVELMDMVRKSIDENNENYQDLLIKQFNISYKCGLQQIIY